MNYFAHAWLAARRSRAPVFVLGAMLPDWQRWVGGRLRAAHHRELASGVRFHHACDVAFHGSPTFHALEREAFRELQGEGVSRGPARGVAHVGVELLLDAALLGSRELDATYLAALEAADAVGPCLEWTGTSGASRFDEVVARLRSRGVPRDASDPDLAGKGILRTLESRPRLRVPEGEEGRVLAWARRTGPRVAEAQDALFGETEARLPGAEAKAPTPASSTA